MALKAQVIKAQLQIADMDRHHYQDYALHLAQHPSETDERLMIRLLAFILNASEQLEFARDLSGEGGAELWSQNLHGDIELWVLFGTPDEKWIRKASQQSRQVKIYAYGGRSVPVWWQQNAAALQRYTNLEVWQIADDSVQALGALADRRMELQCSINEGQVWITQGTESVALEPQCLKGTGV
ncbi:YaeQ protein [Nitrincola lacisaponensis]|uniref:YaeQ protein n=1 Tax=Nitrincola lacisaponensis TaxID=267850 RepID=A0A063Y8R1_9GAMM|nr:YaeQ family protein [Nitrincola lacisaponensis]KDE41450.1 YaeQ protein [Nitrincola lacisaponensis]